jgi:hypothetical protein
VVRYGGARPRRIHKVHADARDRQDRGRGLVPAPESPSVPDPESLSDPLSSLFVPTGASRPGNRERRSGTRTAADTGDSKYNAYSWEVRAIRNGETPRPETAVGNSPGGVPTRLTVPLRRTVRRIGRRTR